jgi:hypothetical protein
MVTSSRLVYATSILLLLCATSSIVTWYFLIAGRRFSKMRLFHPKHKLKVLQEIIGILLFLGSVVLLIITYSPLLQQGM